MVVGSEIIHTFCQFCCSNSAVNTLFIIYALSENMVNVSVDVFFGRWNGGHGSMASPIYTSLGGPGPERRPRTLKFWTLGDGLIDHKANQTRL